MLPAYAGMIPWGISLGGRGASSGWSVDKNGNPKNLYGSQYHALLTVGNIKFVSKNGAEQRNAYGDDDSRSRLRPYRGR